MSPLRLQVQPLEGRAVPAALVQVVHNSPYPSAAGVDVYLNGLLVPELTDLRFREATPPLTVPSLVPVAVEVRPSGGLAGSALFTQTSTFGEGTTTVVQAVGNPGAAADPLRLVAAPVPPAPADTRVRVLAAHGSPDAPAVDVVVRGVGTVADDLTYPNVGPSSLGVAPGRHTVDVFRADGVTPVGSFAADFPTGGRTVTVLASGFSGSPPAGAERNTFALLAVNPDGTTAVLAPAARPVPPVAPAGRPAFAVGGVGKLIAYTAAGGTAFTASPFGEVVIGGEVSQVRVATADLTGDGVPDVVAGVGPAGPESAASGVGASRVVVLDGATNTTLAAFDAFEPRFVGGVFVAAADLTGDGKAEVIVTPDQGGGPVVAIYDGAKLAAGLPLSAQLVRFFGIEDAAFRGGARAAAGDLNADGTPDVVVAAGFGGGPRVAVFDGRGLTAARPKLVPDFFVFEPTLRNGVYVAAGDLTGDGAADLVVGGGPGGGPRVFALDGRALTTAGTQTVAANFFAGDPGNRDGVRVAARDVDGDGRADVLVGLGAAGTPQVRAFSGPGTAGPNPSPLAGLELTPFDTFGAVFVG